MLGATPAEVGEIAGDERLAVRPRAQRALPRTGVLRPDRSAGMTALLHGELLKLRTTRTFAALVASATALSVPDAPDRRSRPGIVVPDTGGRDDGVTAVSDRCPARVAGH